MQQTGALTDIAQHKDADSISGPAGLCSLHAALGSAEGRASKCEHSSPYKCASWGQSRRAPRQGEHVSVPALSSLHHVVLDLHITRRPWLPAHDQVTSLHSGAICHRCDSVLAHKLGRPPPPAPFCPMHLTWGHLDNGGGDLSACCSSHNCLQNVPQGRRMLR